MLWMGTCDMYKCWKGRRIFYLRLLINICIFIIYYYIKYNNINLLLYKIVQIFFYKTDQIECLYVSIMLIVKSKISEVPDKYSNTMFFIINYDFHSIFMAISYFFLHSAIVHYLLEEKISIIQKYYYDNKNFHFLNL